MVPECRLDRQRDEASVEQEEEIKVRMRANAHLETACIGGNNAW